MAADTPGTWTVLDGTGAAKTAQLTTVGSIITPSISLRTNGGAVEVGNGLPVIGYEYYSTVPTLTAGQVTYPALDVNANTLARVKYVVTIAPTEQSAGTIVDAQATPYGAHIVDTESLTPTYGAAGGPLIAASASNVPLAWIQGSATKTVRIKRIIVQGFGLPTTAEQVNILIYRYSGATAFAGAGVTTPSPVQFDINDPAPTAVVSVNSTGGAITANPTKGGGALRDTAFEASSTVNTFSVEFDFGALGKSLIVRGTSDWIAVVAANGGTTNASSTFAIDWTEV